VAKLYLFLALFVTFTVYSAIVYTTGTSGISHPDEEITRGKLVFQHYNCSACHQLYGLGGYLGPDLTTVMSQPGKGAGYVRGVLKTGTQRMPDFKLSDENIRALVGFLSYVDQTAITYKTKTN